METVIEGIESIRTAVPAGIGEEYISMTPVTYQEYLEYASKHDHVVIGGVKLPLKVKVKEPLNPVDFTVETTTVWSFPKRGTWATHRYNARYRGNWAPQVARNLILLYSKENDVVLDPFMGSGTTIIECKLLKRYCIGVDINYDAVMLAWSRLDFTVDGEPPDSRVRLYWGDARNLDAISDESVDLIATHPPYAGIIRYGNSQRIEGDLSGLRDVDLFAREMRRVASEFYRVLKPGGHAAVMIGDARINKHIVPIGFRVLQVFLEEGFVLREHIIKVQHNMNGTRKWVGRNRGFLLIKHEHIFVFRKRRNGESPRKNVKSAKWW